LHDISDTAIQNKEKNMKRLFKISMELLCVIGGTLLVAQLVEALRYYKLEGLGFDFRWRH